MTLRELLWKMIHDKNMTHRFSDAVPQMRLNIRLFYSQVCEIKNRIESRNMVLFTQVICMDKMKRKSGNCDIELVRENCQYVENPRIICILLSSLLPAEESGRVYAKFNNTLRTSL